MTQFNFINSKNAISYDLSKNKYALKSNKNSNDLQNVLEEFQYNPIKKTKKLSNFITSFFIKNDNILFLEKIIAQSINYLATQRYLPEGLPPEINIKFLKTQKISLFSPKEEKDIQDKNGLAAVKLGTKIPEIFISLDLLAPRNKKYSNYLEMCKSVFSDINKPNTKEKISFEEQQGLMIETAFLHEFGHILSVVKHINKNYFLTDTQEPILDSFKRNYEESFAEGFCIYILNEKYPNNKFLPWLGTQRREDALYFEGNNIYPYVISAMFESVVKKSGLAGIEEILTHIEACACNNIEANLKEKIKNKNFLSNLNQELHLINTPSELKNEREIIQKIKNDFNSFTAPTNHKNLSGKILKFRDLSVRSHLLKYN